MTGYAALGLMACGIYAVSAHAVKPGPYVAVTLLLAAVAAAACYAPATRAARIDPLRVLRD
ncbi:MAG TPA: hypothetical protein VGQ16_13040 [Vicinamibacterales bacterium]|nr:hypothetical protein [Vicinamibacterales bacterium]